MRVSKILNNNLVLSKNEKNEEIIVKGLGLVSAQNAGIK